MRSYFTFLPLSIQREMHFPNKSGNVLLSLLSFVGNIYRDINGHIQLYKSDIILFSSNPLITMSYIVNNPQYKSICVVSSPDVAETIAFPYNLIELADFRAVIEKLLFKEELLIKKEGYNMWMQTVIENFKMKTELVNQNVFFFDNDYKLGGNREFFTNNNKFLFTYLGRVLRQEKERSKKCEDIRRKLWGNLKSQFTNYSFYIKDSDEYSYSVIQANHVVNLDLEKSYENFEKWLVDSFNILNDPSHDFEGEKIFVRN